jgi:hypothetical protein
MIVLYTGNIASESATHLKQAHQTYFDKYEHLYKSHVHVHCFLKVLLEFQFLLPIKYTVFTEIRKEEMIMGHCGPIISFQNCGTFIRHADEVQLLSSIGHDCTVHREYDTMYILCSKKKHLFDKKTQPNCDIPINCDPKTKVIITFFIKINKPLS